MYWLSPSCMSFIKCGGRKLKFKCRNEKRMDGRTDGMTDIKAEGLSRVTLKAHILPKLAEPYK